MRTIQARVPDDLFGILKRRKEADYASFTWGQYIAYLLAVHIRHAHCCPLQLEWNPVRTGRWGQAAYRHREIAQRFMQSGE